MKAQALVTAAILSGTTLAAQTIQNPTLRRAQQAFDNLDYRQALSGGRAALRAAQRIRTRARL